MLNKTRDDDDDDDGGDCDDYYDDDDDDYDGDDDDDNDDDGDGRYVSDFADLASGCVYRKLVPHRLSMEVRPSH